jgi:hypothetical protein
MLEGKNPLKGKDAYFIKPKKLPLEFSVQKRQRSSISFFKSSQQNLTNSHFTPQAGPSRTELKRGALHKKSDSMKHSLQNSKSGSKENFTTLSKMVNKQNEASPINVINVSSSSSKIRSPVLNENIKILTPGVYYLPKKKKIKFLIFWKNRENLVLEGIDGEVVGHKVNENVFEFQGSFDEGLLYVSNESGSKLIEFNVVDYHEKEIPDQLLDLIDFC